MSIAISGAKTKVPVGLSGIPVDRERAIQTYPWVLLVTFTFPGEKLQNNDVVKFARDRLVRWLGDQEISAFYIIEKHAISGKPHFHFLLDQTVAQSRLYDLWVRALVNFYEPSEIVSRFVDRRAVDPKTLDTDLSDQCNGGMVGYLVKQHRERNFRESWKAELKKNYGISYLWGTLGSGFSHHYSSVRIGMLANGELPSETDSDSLTAKLQDLNDHLELHQFQLTEKHIKQLEQERDIHYLMATLFSLGGKSFEEKFNIYVNSRDETPFEKRFKAYLEYLTFRPVLKMLIVKLSVVARQDSRTKWPGFAKDLFYATTMLNFTQYKKIVGSLPDDMPEEKVALRCGIPLYDIFKVSFSEQFTFDLTNGYGDSSGAAKQVLVCRLNYDNPITPKLGDALFSLFHKFCFPMVMRPKDWVVGQPHSGGYLANGTKIEMPLYESFDGRLTESPMLLKAVNWLQSCPFTINYRYVDHCARLFGVDPKRGEELHRLVEGIKNKARTDSLDELKKFFGRGPRIVDGQKISYEMFEKMNKELSEYYATKEIYGGYNVLRKLAKEKLGYDYPGDEGLFVYFPCGLDYRHRIYYRTNLSPTNTKLCRFAVQAPLGQPFVLDNFKAYVVSVFYGSVYRPSRTKALRFFDEVLHRRMVAFQSSDVRPIYEEADEPEAMLSCCYEYQRLNEHLNKFQDEELALKLYRSKFFISIDFTASGLQILSALFGNGAFAAALNIRPIGPDDDHGSIYLELYRIFRNERMKGLAEWEDFGFEDPVSYEAFAKSGDTLETLMEKCFLPVFKKAAMAGPYGITFSTFADHAHEQLSLGDFNFNARAFVIPKIYEFVKESLLIKDFLDFMKILSDHAKLKDIPVSFPTLTDSICTLGHTKTESMIVRMRQLNSVKIAKLTQKKKKLTKAEETQLKAADFRSKVTISQSTDELDHSAIANSLPPNVIHGCDASLVVHFVLSYGKNLSFMVVHDCFYFTTDQLDSFYAELQCLFHELFIGSKYMETKFIPAQPREIQPVLLARLREIQNKHSFDASFLLDHRVAGRALLY